MGMAMVASITITRSNSNLVYLRTSSARGKPSRFSDRRSHSFAHLQSSFTNKN